MSQNNDHSIRFCPACGETINPNQNFCKICGNPVKPSSDNMPLQGSSVTDGIENVPQQPQTGQQNVQINAQTQITVKYADTGDRLLALIIDSILISLVTSAITNAFGLGFLLNGWPPQLGALFWENNIVRGFLMFLYFFLFEAYNKGQTIGKIIMKIKTVDAATLNNITMTQAALHVVGKAFFLLIDWIIGEIINEESEKKKSQLRITQRFSKTAVISIDPKKKLE
jgi:uncharacterized RDD family membrane protein YckC